jgi:hypothetical protein
MSYLYVDGATATTTLVRGGAGLDFEDGRDGFCAVDFELALVAP